MTDIMIVLQVILFIVSAPTPYYGVSSEGFEEQWVHQELQPLAIRLSEITGISEHRVLYEVFGELHFEYRHIESWQGNSCWACLVCKGNPDIPLREGVLLHELGHRLINDSGKTGTELADYTLGYYENDDYIHVSGYNPETGKFERTMSGFDYYQNNLDLTYKEDYADMFMLWAMGGKDFCGEAGRLRYNFIDNFINERLVELKLLTLE